MLVRMAPSHVRFGSFEILYDWKQHDQLKVLADYVIAQGRDKLCEQVDEITGAKVLGLFTDIDVQLGERVFVFTMDRELQNGNRKQTAGWWIQK